MTTTRLAVKIVKAIAAAVAGIAIALALVAPDADTLDLDLKPPAHAPADPTWSGLDAARFPGCEQIHGTRLDERSNVVVPTHIVAATRTGHRSLLPFAGPQTRQTRASWHDADPANDLFVIGVCYR